MNEPKFYSLLYCRVSDAHQTGLQSQEQRCRKYSDEKGYEYEKTFYDEVA